MFFFFVFAPTITAKGLSVSRMNSMEDQDHLEPDKTTQNLVQIEPGFLSGLTKPFVPSKVRSWWWRVFGVRLLLCLGISVILQVININNGLWTDHESSYSQRPLSSPSKPSCNASNVALAYISIGLLPRMDSKAPVFSWAMHTLAAHGEFCGHVMVVTDAPQRVHTLLTEVLQSHPHCRSIFHVIAVHRPEFAVRGPTLDMFAKSFKTKMFDLLPKGVDAERILYLDSDILVVEPVQVALNAAFRHDNYTALKMISGYSQRPEKWHGGLLLFSREASGCLGEWAEAITSNKYSRDQIAFMYCPTCLEMVHELPRELMYFPDELDPKLPNAAVFVHYTTTKRARKFMQHGSHLVHRMFLERIGGIPEKCLDLFQVNPDSQPTLSWWYDPSWYFGSFGEHSLSRCS